MYYADYHTHSSCSPDGHVPMTEMAAAAVAAGLGELCLTDHCDLVDNFGAATPTHDWAPALAQFAQMEAAYGAQLQLRFGLEFGSGHLNRAAARQILAQPQLDFVIGSVHNCSAAAGGRDFYYLDYHTDEDCYRALDDYFAALAALSACPDCYSVLGHIIYPLRYMNVRDGRTASLARYLPQIEAILAAAIGHNRGIEVNTWRGQTVEEWVPVLTRYRALGGEIITVGSDAHQSWDVGKGVPQAYDLLRTLGFRYITLFDKRKPRFLPL